MIVRGLNGIEMSFTVVMILRALNGIYLCFHYRDETFVWFWCCNYKLKAVAVTAAGNNMNI